RAAHRAEAHAYGRATGTAHRAVAHGILTLRSPCSASPTEICATRPLPAGLFFIAYSDCRVAAAHSLLNRARRCAGWLMDFITVLHFYWGIFACAQRNDEDLHSLNYWL